MSSYDNLCDCFPSQSDDNSDVRRAAVQELARGWKDDPKTLEILRDRFANAPDEKVREFAEKQLAKLDKL